MTTTTRTVTVSVLKRDWNDIEPKLVAFLATGLTATAVVSAGDYVGLHIPVGLAMLIVMVVGAVAEYIKSSTNKVDVPAEVVPAPTSGYATSTFVALGTPEAVSVAPTAPSV